MFSLFSKIIQISRPLYWPISFLLLALGLKAAGRNVQTQDLGIMLIFSVAFSVWVSATNNLGDIETDSTNPLKGGVFGPRTSMGDKTLLIAVSSVSLVVVGVCMFWVNNLPFTSACVVAVGASYLYSLPPVHLKTRPPLDALSNGLFSAAFVLCGGFMYLPVFSSERLYFIAVSLFTSASAVQIVGTLKDLTSDRAAGLITFAITYGRKGAALTALALYFITGLLCIPYYPLYCIPSALGVVACMYLLKHPEERISAAITLVVTAAYCLAGIAVIFL